MTKQLDLAKAKLKAAGVELTIAQRTLNQAHRRWTRAMSKAKTARERLDDLMAKSARKDQ